MYLAAGRAPVPATDEQKTKKDPEERPTAERDILFPHISLTYVFFCSASRPNWNSYDDDDGSGTNPLSLPRRRATRLRRAYVY